MGPKVKHEFPDSQHITVDDYAELLDGDFMKSHLAFFWSQIGTGSTTSWMRSWYQKEILEPSRARLPPFQNDPDIFGVGERVHREGMFTSTAIEAGLARGRAQPSYKRDRLQAKEFQGHYEKECRSKYGKKWNMVHTQGMRLSQAYAMHAVGPVALLFTEPRRDGRNMSRNTSWGGCEFPSLTRNKSIQKIYQVDLKKPLFDEEGRLNPRLIWSRPDGDGPTKHEPLGHLYSFGGYSDRVYEPSPLLDKALEERARRKNKKKVDPSQGAGLVLPTQPGTGNAGIPPQTVTLQVRSTLNTATAAKTHDNTAKIRATRTSNTAANTKTTALSTRSAPKPDVPKTPNPPIAVPPPAPVVPTPPAPKTSARQSRPSPQPQPNKHPNRISCKFKRALKRFLRIKPKDQRK